MFKATMKNGKRIKSPIAEEKKFLEEKASEISKEFKGNPPVIIVVGGKGSDDNDLEPPRVIFGTYPEKSRYRDRLGILQTAIHEDYYAKYLSRLRPTIPTIIADMKKKEPTIAD
jgi:hypothetical protein